MNLDRNGAVVFLLCHVACMHMVTLLHIKIPKQHTAAHAAS